MKSPAPITVLLLAVALAWPSAAVASDKGNRCTTAIGVVPFQNNNGGARAVAGMMLKIHSHLGQRGFMLVGNGRVEEYLRRNRIREHHAISREHAAELARLLGVRYLLLGTIDALHVNGGPEVGLTARIMDPQDGSVVWADSVNLHAVEAPGVLAMLRAKTLDEASDRAIRRLFSSVVIAKDGALRFKQRRRGASRALLARAPISYRDPDWRDLGVRRIAILPFANRTLHPEAPLMVADHMLSVLLGLDGVEVVDPGELRRVLIEHDIQPLFGLSLAQLRELRELLGVDGVLDGSVLTYDAAAQPPTIDLIGRLRDARTGKVLWSATTRRHGSQTRTVYDLGRIYGAARLTRGAVEDLLSTCFR